MIGGRRGAGAQETKGGAALGPGIGGRRGAGAHLEAGAMPGAAAGIGQGAG